MKRPRVEAWFLGAQLGLLAIAVWLIPMRTRELLMAVEGEQAAAVRRAGILESRADRRDRAQDEFNDTMIKLLEEVVTEIKQMRHREEHR